MFYFGTNKYLLQAKKVHMNFAWLQFYVPIGYHHRDKRLYLFRRFFVPFLHKWILYCSLALHILLLCVNASVQQPFDQLSHPRTKDFYLNTRELGNTSIATSLKTLKTARCLLASKRWIRVMALRPTALKMSNWVAGCFHGNWDRCPSSQN